MEKRKCGVEGCNNPIWSKGMCKVHQQFGGFKKVNKIDLKKKSPLRKLSSKKKATIGEAMLENHKMKMFFMDIWNKLPVKVCWSCGIWLGSEPATYMFDHLLEKSKYPHLKFTEDNIFICCLECHDAKNKGYPKVAHEEAIQRAKEKFLT